MACLGAAYKSDGDYALAADKYLESVLMKWDAGSFKGLSDCLKEMNVMDSPEQILISLYKNPAD